MSDPLGFLGAGTQQASPVGPRPEQVTTDDPLSFLGPAQKQTDELSMLGAVAPEVPQAGTIATPAEQRRAPSHPHAMIGEIILTQVRQIGEALKMTLASAPRAGMVPFKEGYRPGDEPLVEQTDPTKPIVTKDYVESYSEYQWRRASEGDPDAQAKINDALYGAAMIASFPVASGATSLLKLAPAAMQKVVGKTGAFLIAEGLGGASFGAIRPLSEGESRGEAVRNDAAIFATWGGIVRGAIGVFSRKQKLAVAASAAAKMKQAADDISAAGQNPANLPPIEKQAVQARAWQEAMAEADPAAVNLEQAAAATSQRIGEPAPRFDNVINFDDILGPGPRDIDIPGPFNLERFERLEGSQRIEPLPPPPGFIQGVGRPARMIEDVAGLEVTAYRGVPAGVDPLHPGHADATFMSDRPMWAAYFVNGIDGDLPSGTIHQIKYRFKRPKIVGTWEELGRLDVFRDMPDIVERLRKEGYDGIIIRDSEAGAPEYLALNGSGRVVTSFPFADPRTQEALNYFGAGAYTPRGAVNSGYAQYLQNWMEAWETAVIPLRASGMTVDDATASAVKQIVAQEMRRDPSTPVLILTDHIQHLAQVTRKFTGDDFVESMLLPGTSEAAIENPPIRQALIDAASAAGADPDNAADIMLAMRNSVLPELRRFGAGDELPGIILDVASDAGIPYEQMEAVVGKYLKLVPRSVTIEELKTRAAEKVFREALEEVLPPAAIEPREVTPAMPRPEGIRPTALAVASKADIPQGAPSIIEEAALAQHAVREAVERIDPVTLMTPDLRGVAVELEQALADPATRIIRGGTTFDATLERALEREGTLAEQGLTLNTMEPTIRELSLTAKVPAAQRRTVRKILNQALAREMAPIEIPDPFQQINASWIDDAVGGTGPINPKMSGWEIAAKMTDEQLKAFENITLNEKGAISQALLARLTLGGIGSVMEVASTSDRLDVGERNALRSVGALFLVAAGGSALAKWAKDIKFTRRFIQMYAHESVLSGGAKDAARQYRELFTFGRTLAVSKKNYLEGVFKTEDLQKLASFVVDEGPRAPEYALLSPAQQVEAKAAHQMQVWLARMTQAEGVFDSYQQAFFTNVLPKETYQRWVGLHAAQRPQSLRAMEAWAKANSLKGPRTDLPSVAGLNVESAYRMISARRVQDTMKRLGYLQKPATGQVLPAGMREVKVARLRGLFAPDDVAAALENISRPDASNFELANMADKVKAWWMRGIMFWFWEHGLNAMRSLPGITLNPYEMGVGIGRSWAAVKKTDPAMFEAAKHGLALFDRPDFGARIPGLLDAILSKLGPAAPTAQALQKQGAHLLHLQDRILWDRAIPALGLFAYQTQMKRWVEQTAGKFLPGTPEYITAARRAADFGNKVMGKVPKEMQNPELARALRLVMFSPNWTLTRISLTTHAMSELGDFASGKIKADDLLYLPFKMRTLMASVALTWVGSRLLSGKAPEFNPNTNKYYMRTGIRNQTGREMGVDLTGWWQDDLKLFNVPDKFFAGRLNPSLTALGDAVSGRNYLGQPQTGMERLDNLFRSFGPLPELVETGIRMGQEAARGRGLPAAETLQRTSGILATGNVSALPRPIDTLMSEQARKLLNRTGVPANDENIFTLAQLMRSNYISRGAAIDDRVLTFLAYRKRLQRSRGGAVSHLWQGAREIFVDLVLE